jgi:hypothetical protein
MIEFKAGQILNHYSRYHTDEEELLASHIITEVHPDALVLFMFYTKFPELDQRNPRLYAREYVEEEAEDNKFFYWRIE